MKKLMTICAVVLMMTGAASTSLGAILVDRGLPTINLNNAAGANRSNVTWASESSTGFTGDDFMIGTIGQSYVIDSITVWGAQYNPLSLDIDNIWLYMGKAGVGNSLALVSSGSVAGNTNSNSNITHAYVNYPSPGDPLGYQGNSGGYYPICQTTFSGLNYAVDGGVKYNFGVKGDKWLWWNHASNAGLSGSPQDGADGKYLTFDTADLSSAIVTDSNGNGWDKSSDINVLVTGVPEPATMLLVGLGAVLLRKKK
jgi:hypothetical protein